MKPPRCHPWGPWARALTPMPVATPATSVAIAARRKNRRRGLGEVGEGVGVGVVSLMASSFPRFVLNVFVVASVGDAGNGCFSAR
jgi:hypothetical protein